MATARRTGWTRQWRGCARVKHLPQTITQTHRPLRAGTGQFVPAGGGAAREWWSGVKIVAGYPDLLVMLLFVYINGQNG
jgi:hypothetical protein